MTRPIKVIRGGEILIAIIVNRAFSEHSVRLFISGELMQQAVGAGE